MDPSSTRPVLTLEHHEIVAPLPRSVGNARARWTERRAILVVLRDEGGARGVGEAAPLPGLSRESLEDVRAELAALGTSIEPASLDLAARSPSLRFAIEAALLDLRAGERPAYAALLDDATRARVPERLELQILLDDLDLAEETARRAHAAGARTFKVKIGRAAEAAREAALLLGLRALGRDVVIRADANGRIDEPEILVPALDHARVEYVEDPFAFDADARPRAWVGVPVALDAAVAEDPLGAMARARSLGAPFVVLKPTLLGGIGRTLQLAAHARTRGLKVVLSHCLEGPVGLSALAHLARAASASSHRALWGAQGLAPWRGADGFVLGGAPLVLPDCFQPASIGTPSSAGLGVRHPVLDAAR
jgi:O-succinylbenzoate synthase